ncbi:MAG: serine hydrolase [Pyrinomonadaceae bacterium]|nr:serine hydrolase [Pyrinomonadaceae bacterium]MBP6213282.1 serine hydrolase [Pyrinomonadaceae bacterium]
MQRRILILTVIIVIAATAAIAQKAKSIPAAPQTLDDRIQAALDGFQGKAWIYAKNLDTGKEYAFRADEPTRTASTVKLAIMAEAFRQVEQGKLKWNDEIVLTKEKKVGGSGVLSELSDNTRIDLKSALNFMIVVSDNTGTNLVLDKVGADNVNDLMDSLGLPGIKSMRKVFGGGDSKAGLDPQNRVFGLGRSTMREMVKLVEMMERGTLVSKDASAEMINILKRQQYKDGIGRGVPDTIPVASKSGALDRLRSDVGVIYTRRGRIAMAITVDDLRVVAYDQENPGLAMLWKLSQILQDGLGK